MRASWPSHISEKQKVSGPQRGDLKLPGLHLADWFAACAEGLVAVCPDFVWDASLSQRASRASCTCALFEEPWRRKGDLIRGLRGSMVYRDYRRYIDEIFFQSLIWC